MNPQLLNIDGYGGSVLSKDQDLDLDRVYVRVFADMDQRFPLGWREQWEANDPAVREASRRAFEYHLFAPDAIRYHNLAVPAAQMYLAAARLAPLAVAEAGHRYEALGNSTTVNRPAAHHAFAAAAARARDLLTEVVNAAIALRECDFGRHVKGIALVIYERAVPAEQRLTLPDVDDAQLALTAFVETTRARLDVLPAPVSDDHPEGLVPAADRPQPGRVMTGRRAGTAVVAAERRR